jgi:hypothetical protein
MTWSLILSLALLGQSAPAAEKDPALEELAAKVTKLVKQLDDEELARREAAEKGLVELGYKALDLLPATTIRTSAETKERLGRVRRQLELALAESAAKPTLVTLKGDMRLSEAIAAITKQTKNNIVDYRSEQNQQETDPIVKVDFKDTPFWEALDKVFDEAGMTLYAYSGKESSLAMVARAVDTELPRSGRAAYAGRFRFEGLNVVAARDLRNPANHGLRLTYEASWEPQLKPIVLIQPLDQIVALSEDGKPLVVAGTEGSEEVAIRGTETVAEFEVNLQLPPRDVQKIASLQGKMTAIVPGKVETFEFADVMKAKNQVQRRAGVAVVLEEVRKNNDIYELRMRVEFDKAANALESHRGWIFDNPAALFAPDGTEISPDSYEETRRESNIVGIAYLFALEDEPKGYKFVYKTPAAIMKLPVEFELKNIELP